MSLGPPTCVGDTGIKPVTSSVSGGCRRSDNVRRSAPTCTDELGAGRLVVLGPVGVVTQLVTQARSGPAPTLLGLRW